MRTNIREFLEVVRLTDWACVEAEKSMSVSVEPSK